MFEFIVGGSLILMALIGSHWMLYRRGYYRGIEDARLWQYEKELRDEQELRENFNSNYEELPIMLRRQAD